MLATLVLSLLGGIMVAVATRGGVIAAPDATVYLGISENVVEGRGLTTPFVNTIDTFSPSEALSFDGAVPNHYYPPLYPTVLGAINAVGLSSQGAARLLDTVLMMINVGLLCAVAARLSANRTGAVIATGSIAATSSLLVLSHVSAASETMYAALLLLGVLILDDANERGFPTAWRWLFVLVASLAMLTRFVGVALLATGVWALLRRPGVAWRDRLVQASPSLLAPVPLLLWAVYGAGGSSRELAYHPPGLDQVRLAYEQVLDTLAGASTPTLLRILVVLGAAAVIVAGAASMLRRYGISGSWRRVTGGGLMSLLVIAAALHLAVLWFSYAFIDQTLAFTFRQLLPALVLLLPVAVQLAADLVPRNAAIGWRHAGLSVLVGAVVAGQVAAVGDVVLDGELGPHNSEAAAEATNLLEQLPADTLVFTNDPNILWAWTGRPVLALPWTESPLSGKPNEQLEGHLVEFEQIVAENDVVVVYLNEGLIYFDYLLSPEALSELVELEPVPSSDAFQVYQADPA